MQPLENDSSTKFCEDCKHYKKDWLFGWFNSDLSTCEAPQNKKSDLITRKETYKYFKFCLVLRSVSLFDDMCGSEAKWFEDKNANPS
jgi:hypothetical protein